MQIESFEVPEIDVDHDLLAMMPRDELTTRFIVLWGKYRKMATANAAMRKELDDLVERLAKISLPIFVTRDV